MLGIIQTQVKADQPVTVYFPNGSSGQFIAAHEITSVNVAVIGDRVFGGDQAKIKNQTTTRLFKGREDIEDDTPSTVLSLWQEFDSGGDPIPFAKSGWANYDFVDIFDPDTGAFERRRALYERAGIDTPFSNFNNGNIVYDRRAISESTTELDFSLSRNPLTAPAGGFIPIVSPEYENRRDSIADAFDGNIREDHFDASFHERKYILTVTSTGSGNPFTGLVNTNWLNYFFRNGQQISRDFDSLEGITVSGIPFVSSENNGLTKIYEITTRDAVDIAVKVDAPPLPRAFQNQVGQELIGLNVNFDTRLQVLEPYEIWEKKENIAWWVNWHNTGASPVKVFECDRHETIRVFLSKVDDTKGYFVAKLSRMTDNFPIGVEYARVVVVELNLSGTQIETTTRTYDNPDPIPIDADNWQIWAYSYLEGNVLGNPLYDPLGIEATCAGQISYAGRRLAAASREFSASTFRDNKDYDFGGEIVPHIPFSTLRNPNDSYIERDSYNVAGRDYPL